MTFTVMQWNCLYSEDIPKIAAFITAHRPDVICLQELTDGYKPGTETGRQLADMLGYHAFCAYGPMVLPDGAQTLMGNGILSRLPFVYTSRHVIQPGHREGKEITADERYYLEVGIIFGDTEVVFGTTHLPFHPTFQTTPYKQGLVEEIISHIPHDKPYILTGDFNAPPDTKAARSFRRVGLRNAGPAFAQNTWTTKPFTIGPHTYNELDWRLDYVLYKGRLKPVASHILETDLSDHLPIFANFEI